MHLITPLVNGVRGAESGSVDFYRRGTTTRVAYYTSFEGDGSTTPTGSVDLDEYGGGVFYVNETVTVVVKDSTGTELRRFVSAYAASGVEVISQSFTGTDYATGASAASEPLALSTALDRLYTSFGALDFNVLFGGASTTLQAALAGIGSLYFNVKSPTYGATGDGVTADRAAIQAALDAASAAGGGIVFFPKGTYLVTGSLNVPDKVNLLGVGAGASIIRLATDAGSGLVLFTTSTYRQTVDNLRFDAAVATGRSMIASAAATLLIVRNCYFGSSTFTGIGISTDTTGVEVTIFNCTFETTTSGVSASAGNVFALLCRFILPATFNGSMFHGSTADNEGFVLAFCDFATTAMSAGTGALILATGNSGIRGVVIGCRAPNPAGGTLSLWAGPGIDSSAADGAIIIGNLFGSAITRSAVWGEQALASTYRGSFDFERERARYYTADDTAGVAISAMTYAVAEVMRTNNGAQTVTLDGPGPTNQSFTLVYHNNHAAGGGTITMAGNVKGLTTFTVNADCVSYYFFKSVHRGTSKHWACVGSAVNTPE